MNRKITDEIYQVGGAGFTSPEDAAIYLIDFDGEAALVDAGCGRSVDRLMENIRSCGVNPAAVGLLLITHCHFDHTGGARELKERLGCRVVAHEFDAVYMENGDSTVTAASWYGAFMNPVTVDRKLSGAEAMIDLGGRAIRAFHAPGHFPGSVVYLTESRGKRILFAHDVHGPLDPSFLSDRSDYESSLRLLLSLDADVLCEGHFGIYEGKAAVAGFIRSFL